MHGYMVTFAQFEGKFKLQSVCGTFRSGGAFDLGRRH